jgi:general transcription factor 3C polypeptide 5 (transcription factor C subunit 1)
MEEDVIDQRKHFPVDVKYLSVEYPGKVVNENNAIRTLGGIEELSRIHENDEKIMRLNFRPGHWSSHPLYGDRSPTSNLLLKVKIPLNKEKKVESEIVGIIPHTFEFKSLSDFQFLFPKPPTEETNEIVFEIPEAKTVEILPRSFLKVDHPQPYNFERSPAFYYDETQKQWLRRPTKRRKFISAKVPANIKEIPRPLDSLPHLSVQSKALYEQLKKLFETRPMWLKGTLKLNIAQDMHSRLAEVLPLVAYFFRGGPWRHSWVRLGYDPRKDKESRVYQTLDYRIKVATRHAHNFDVIEQSYRTKIKATIPFSQQHIGREGSLLPDFTDQDVRENATPKTPLKEKVSESNFTAKPSSKSTSFQLLDVELDDVKKLIKQTSGVYHEKYGWYSQKTIKDIRNIMNKKFISFFEEVREENKEKDGNEIDEMGAPTMRDSDEEYEGPEEDDEDEDDESEDENKDDGENEMASAEPIEVSQNIGFLSQLMKNVATGEEINDDFLKDSLVPEFNNFDQDMDVEAFNIL